MFYQCGQDMCKVYLEALSAGSVTMVVERDGVKQKVCVLTQKGQLVKIYLNEDKASKLGLNRADDGHIVCV